MPEMPAKMKIVLIGAAVAVAVGLILAVYLNQLLGSTLDVKFVSFALDRSEIKVGEGVNLIFNVQNLEERAIDNARVILDIKPPGNDRYFSISNNTVYLPTMFGKDARTGEIKVSIAAIGLPAKEAVYSVHGILYVGAVQTDSREIDLRIHAS